MRPKNLTECITFAITTGPLNEVIPRIRNELQDYFAHEVMKFAAKRSRAEQLVLIEFFKHVFKEEK